jgi:glutathione synthase/RimK-type ligase-like ATP-grasp enzyme
MSDYILKNRVLNLSIKAACKKYSINYKSYSDDWVIELEKNNTKHFIYFYEFDINNQVSALIANDKVAAYQILKSYNVAVVPHILLSSVVNPIIDLNILNKSIYEFQDLVLKPLKGSRGNNVYRLNENIESLNEIYNSDVISWVTSPFINIDYEIRLIIYKNKIVVAYKKMEPVLMNGLKMFNLNLGAKAVVLELLDIPLQIRKLAMEAINAIGLVLGAVDIIISNSGEALILEINSAFSLEHFALSSNIHRSLSFNFYTELIEDIFGSEINSKTL